MVAEIPGSGYLIGDDNKAVVIPDPLAGSYAIDLSGTPDAPFLTSVSFVNAAGRLANPAVEETIFEGLLGRHGTRALCALLPGAERCTTPTKKSQCKEGGYRFFNFRNQGLCIKAVNHPAT